MSIKLNNKNKIIDHLIIISITIYISVFIIGSSIIDPTGYITGDSTNYLWLSGRILDGHGFFLPPDGREDSIKRWFAIWPIGYPSLISGISWITELSTMMSSKVLNIFLLFLSIYSLYFVLGRNGLIASLVLLTAGTLRNYTMTWSEAPFLTIILMLCLFLGKIMKNELKLNLKNLTLLFLFLILPFLFRYVGLFVLGPTFLVAIYLLYLKRKKDAVSILIVVIFAFIFCLTYLTNNFHLTGYSTGMERYESPEGNYKLYIDLTSAIINELILILPNWNPNDLKQNFAAFFWCLFLIFCLTLIIKKFKQNKVGLSISFSEIFIIYGLIYLFSIIFLRWNAYFETFGFRLLNPGFTLIFVGLVIWVLDKNKNKNCKVSMVVLLVVTVFLVSIGSFYNLLSKHGIKANYFDHINIMKNKYAQLPENAIVIFGSRELRYLRPNIKIANPKFNKRTMEKENWNEFLLSLDTSSPIFIEINSNSNHKTVSSPDSNILSIEKYLNK